MNPSRSATGSYPHQLRLSPAVPPQTVKNDDEWTRTRRNCPRPIQDEFSTHPLMLYVRISSGDGPCA
jgi:hypothetical protein